MSDLASATRSPRPWLAMTGVALLFAALVLPAVTPPGQTWDGAAQAAGFALVFATYPDGRITPRWVTPLLLAYLLWAGATAFVGEVALQPWAQAITVSVLGFLAVLVHRYRRRLSTYEREQVRWAVLGAVFAVVGMTTFVVAVAASGTTIGALGLWGDITATALVAALPVALTVGMVRPRAAPVDVALFHVIRAAFCIVPVTVASAILIRMVPGPVGTWIAVAVVGCGILPLFALAGRLSARFVYRGRLSPRASIRLLDRVLAETHAPDDAPLAIGQVVHRALAVPAVQVVGHGLRSACIGDASAMVARMPVVYAGETIATVHVAPRPAETDLTAADHAILRAITVHGAPALHAAHAMTELVDARAALVIAHEAERKRLRRDLHDDLAPTLVGLRLTASGLVRLLRDGGQDDLTKAADLIVTDVDAAVAQTRALAYGLRPPGLDDGGLASAVRERARSSDDLRVDVTVPEIQLPLQPAVEVAILRIIQEAVTNVRRHAGARRCTVLVSVHPDAVEVTIDDDGRGMRERGATGIGLDSMHDRASELGGRLQVSRSPLGGVRVAAVLPTGPRAVEAAIVP